jgi:hypothetical protein
MGILDALDSCILQGYTDESTKNEGNLQKQRARAHTSHQNLTQQLLLHTSTTVSSLFSSREHPMTVPHLSTVK